MKFFIFLLFFIFFLILSLSFVLSAVVEITIEYGEPSLQVQIAEYPTCALKNSQIEVKAKVVNTGNSSATDTWLALNLPPGWGASNELNKSVGTLEPNQVAWNNVTYNTGERGSYTLVAISNCSEGFGSTDSKNIIVYECGDGHCDSPCEGCSSCSSDCGPCEQPSGQIPSGPFKLPSTSIINETKFYVLVSNLVIQTYVNQSTQTTLTVVNEGNNTLNELRVSILNLSSDWYSISPSFIGKLYPGEKGVFILTYTPKEAGSYKFRINVTSRETFSEFDSLLLSIELKPEEKIEIEKKQEEKVKREEAKAFWEIYSTYIIIFGIIAPLIIAVYMISFILVKRCPLCGSKMVTEYKGAYLISYRCPKCKHVVFKSK